MTEKTASHLSFSEDYSLKVPHGLDLAKLHRVRSEMVFGFDPAFKDGETSYGSFRFKVSQFPIRDSREPMEQVELRLWGFHIEGRKVVCAVMRRPDPQFSRLGKAWPADENHFLYSIEAINVACFSHKPDARVTLSDGEMFKRIIGEALPAYDQRERNIAHRNSPKSTLRVIDSTQAPDPQILSFLSCTTNVTANFEEAEALVTGIDDFFGSDWRQKFDHGYTNTQGIKASGARSEILDALHIVVGNCQYWFTYEFTTDSANDYHIPVGILYSPVFENGIDVSWIGSADELRRNLPKAETIATWYVYKRLHTMVRRHHPEAIINVVSMKGAL